MALSITVFLLMVRAPYLADSDPVCDQAQYLHANGSCHDCPTCGPGQQLSEDCGYGDGGDGHCEGCKEGEFSAETSLAPCWQCTQCSLLNRSERKPCCPASNTVCGSCLSGFYELRRKNGEIEPLCMPCLGPSGSLRSDCLPTAMRPAALLPRAGQTGGKSGAKTQAAQRNEEEPIPVSVIGLVSAASAFFLVLSLWVLMLTVEGLYKRLKWATPRPAESLRSLLPCAMPTEMPHVSPSLAESAHPHRPDHEDTVRVQHSACPDKGVNPSSIIINVTTNIKPGQGSAEECEGHEVTEPELQQMEIHLQEICSKAAGAAVEELDYDTVHDLSLLLNGGRGEALRCLCHELAVPEDILVHIHTFQELFHYLRTSTYTLLPQLAQAAASLHRPDLVARIHRNLTSGGVVRVLGV